MEHLRNSLAHELKQVAVGHVPGDGLVVAECVQLEVPRRGEDDGDQVTGGHPHQHCVGRRPHTGPGQIKGNRPTVLDKLRYWSNVQ